MVQKIGYKYGGYAPSPFTDKIRKVVFDLLPYLALSNPVSNYCNVLHFDGREKTRLANMPNDTLADPAELILAALKWSSEFNVIRRCLPHPLHSVPLGENPMAVCILLSGN